MENIPENAPIKYVQKHQPHFVGVDLEHPKIHDGRVYYFIENIKGSYDVLNMSHILIFENNKYQGFESRK